MAYATLTFAHGDQPVQLSDREVAAIISGLEEREKLFATAAVTAQANESGFSTAFKAQAEQAHDIAVRIETAEND